MKYLAIVTVIAALTSCSSDTDSSTSDTDSSTSDTASTVAWADLDATERQTFMNDNVLPQMKTLFAEWDTDVSSTMQCGTCHGSDLSGGTFAMPNNLYPLTFDEVTNWTFTGDRLEAANFMAGKVVPAMTELLGAEPFDATTGQGFGCFSCHAVAQ